MKAIDLLIKIEVTNHKQNLLFELLGKYGEKLPKEIQDDMRQYAQDFKEHGEGLSKRLVKEVGL